jgi:membrane-bound serine protease (ClpP class)
VPDLLKKLNGRKITLNGGTVTLETDGVALTTIDPDWRSRLLSIITDPNILPILMMLGVMGLLYELLNPGFVLPGVIGGICLLLGLYAVHVLPVNFAGFALILLGIAFMIAEAFLPSFGALGIGGVVAFVVGSIMLFDADVPGFDVAWEVIAGIGIVGAAFFIGVGTFALKARRREVVSGAEQLIGARGEALEAFKEHGRVRVHSEEWQARTHVPLKRGMQIKVVKREGLVLTVEPDKTE